MARPRSLAALALAALVALSLAACGNAKTREELAEEVAHHPVREGLFVPVGPLDYVVYITRQLNPRDPEDREYYDGPEPPPGQVFYGVFLEVCNLTKAPAMPAHSFKVVDSRGHEYEPVELEGDNPFQYEPEQLQPGQCIPNQAGATSFGPTGGAMVLFQLPVAAQENRPLELEIEGGFELGQEHAPVGKIELDL